MHTTTFLAAALAAAATPALAGQSGFARRAKHSSADAGEKAANAKVTPYSRPKGPLDTPWTKGVPTDHPWPEYPRPQMRRADDEWLNLNGLWRFQGSDDSSWANPDTVPKKGSYTNEILVPYCMEGALSGIMDTHTYSWYRTTFATSDIIAGSEDLSDTSRVLLNFGAVDYEATVFVNGNKAGFHRGGYLKFSVDVSDFIYWDDEPNVLEVHAFDPTDGDHDNWDITVGKQTLNPSHIFYTPCSGIWQTVFAEVVPRSHITGVSLRAEMDGTVLANITVTDAPRPHRESGKSGATSKHGDATTSSKKGHATSSKHGDDEATSTKKGASVTSSHEAEATEAAEKEHEKRAAAKKVKVTFLQPGSTTSAFFTKTIPANKLTTFKVPKESFELWSPDHPNLYNVTVEYEEDTVQTYVGFRTISKGKKAGVMRPLLNGEFVFHLGTLDQGFWPDGIYTPPSYEAMVFDLEYLKRIGMNMLRKHIKVENDLFFEACDKLGLILWQDQPCLSPSAPTPPPRDVKDQFEAELHELVTSHNGFPSILVWIPINEGWGQAEHSDWGYPQELTDVIHSADETRLVDATSGWHDRGAGDIHDNHHYSAPQCGTPFYSRLSTPYDPNRIGVQGEFGGVGLNTTAAHLWKVEQAVLAINETYEIDANRAIFNYRALRLFDELREQTELFSCSAAVYTQTTDVEGEVNGLLTYDRRVERPFLEKWQQMFADIYAAAARRAVSGPPGLPDFSATSNASIPALKREYGVDFGAAEM